MEEEEKATAVLAIDEATARPRVSTRIARALARDGTLPGERVGRGWPFVRAELFSYVVAEKRDRPGAVAS